MVVGVFDVLGVLVVNFVKGREIMTLGVDTGGDELGRLVGVGVGVELEPELGVDARGSDIDTL